MKNAMSFNHKKVWFFLITILLFSISSTGFAAIQLQSFSVPANDLSFAFLARIFGTVGGGLVGANATIFGQIFYVLNWGILMIAGVILSYTTGRAIVEIAHAEAGQMARKFSWWVPLRVVVGVGLLVPQATGYSLLNSGVMWVTLQGVGLADAIWSQSVDFLQKGGALYTSPTAATTPSSTAQQLDSTLVDNFKVGTPPGAGIGVGTASILRSAICMEALYQHLDKQKATEASTKQDEIDKLTANLKSEYTDKGLEIPSDYKAKLANLKKAKQESAAPLPTFQETCSATTPCATAPNGECIKFPCNAEGKYAALNGVCGVYIWAPVKPSNINSAEANKGIKDYEAAKKTGLQQIVTGLDRVAVDAVNKEDKDFESFITYTGPNPYTDTNSLISSGFRSFSQHAYERLVTTAGAYQAVIFPARSFAARNYKSGEVEQDIQLLCDAKGENCVPDTENKCNSMNYKRVEAGEQKESEYYVEADVEKKEKEKEVVRCKWGKKSITADMTSKGWIAAGSYYFSLMKVQPTEAMENEYYRFYAATLPISCDDKGSCTLTQELQTALGTDTDSLIKRLLWVGYQNKAGITKTAYELVADLNKTAASSTKAIDLPKELLAFVTEKQLVISLPGVAGERAIKQGVLNAAKYGAFLGPWGMIAGFSISNPETQDVNRFLEPINSALQNVFCAWGRILGLPGLEKTCGYSATDLQTTAKLPPIVKLQWFGDKMITECIDAWQKIFHILTKYAYSATSISATISAFSAGVAAGSFAGVTVGMSILLHTITSAIQTFVKVLVEIPLYSSLPITLTVSTILLTTGATLAYYIPLLPFMLFIFGAIGWLAFVIEAMVAAPIVALGITHPEGGQSDLLGKSEPAIWLLLAVFIRPAAMIIGLIAGVVMSYVAIDILNTGFGAIISSIFYSQPSAGVNPAVESTVGQIKNIAMILVYVLITMSIVQQCFSLIHVIPAQIMRWIGVHEVAGAEAHMAKEVQAGITGTAEKVAGAYGQAAGSIKGELHGATPVGRHEKQPEKTAGQAQRKP